jgi:hypothetical protein
VTGEPGSVLWKIDRDHPTYGFESVELCVNLADELLVVVATSDDEAASTLTRDEATDLRDALTAYLTEEAP